MCLRAEMVGFTCCRSAAIVKDRGARHGLPNRQAEDHPNDRRVDRTEDLNEEEIAAVEASEMEPGFEYLDAELEPAGASVVEVGVDFVRKLRARGDAAK